MSEYGTLIRSIDHFNVFLEMVLRELGPHAAPEIHYQVGQVVCRLTPLQLKYLPKNSLFLSAYRQSLNDKAMKDFQERDWFRIWVKFITNGEDLTLTFQRYCNQTQSYEYHFSFENERDDAEEMEVHFDFQPNQPEYSGYEVYLTSSPYGKPCSVIDPWSSISEEPSRWGNQPHRFIQALKYPASVITDAFRLRAFDETKQHIC